MNLAFLPRPHKPELYIGIIGFVQRPQRDIAEKRKKIKEEWAVATTFEAINPWSQVLAVAGEAG